MARIEASTHVEAEPEHVWGVLVDWESQPRWMVDARSVVVLSPRREGPGTVLRCRTTVPSGLVVTDDMEVTDWRRPHLLGVRHLGNVVRGIGAFELAPTDYGTHLVWWEEVDAPLGPLGEAATQVAIAPLVGRTFRRSLANLKRLCEAPALH